MAVEAGLEHPVWRALPRGAALGLFRLLRAGVLLFSLAAAARAGEALDPARKLSQYKIDTWQTEQGLPQNTIQAVLQTRDGYLWVGTMVGLVRFDGARFTVFDPRHEPDLGSRSILGLMEDAEGGLWVGRSGSALIYRQGRSERAFGEEVTDGKPVWSFCQAKDGVVWAATDNGLVRCERGRTRLYQKADGLPVDKLRSLAIDEQGTLWIGTTGGGLVSFAGGRFQAHSTATGFPHDEIRAVCADPAGGVWAATAGGGLARVRHGRIHSYTVADGLPTDQLTGLAFDAKGTLWIGTWGAGLCRMINGRFSTLSSAGGLAGNQVWSLAADREGSLWVGTWAGGLNRLRNRHFVVLGAPEGLSHDNARSVLRGRDGATWVATAGGGVNRIEGDRITTIRTQDGLPSDETSSLCEAADGSLWIGTYTAGAARLKAGRITTYGRAEGLPGLDVRALCQDRGGTLWAGTMKGLARFDGRRFTPVRELGPALDGVVAILEDRAGTLWFGTLWNGLVRYEDGAFSVLTTKDGLVSNRILALHEDDRGSLWIGTGGGGINRLRNHRIAAIRTSDGLWDGMVQTILEDHQGALWMTCNRGFFRTSRAELDAFADGHAGKVASVGFGAGNALRSTTFAGTQLPSGAVDAAGRLWFPSFSGLVIVDPARLPGPPPPPPVRIEDASADGRTWTGAEAVVLSPGSGPLRIHYTAMTLIDAEQVRFRYRLDGLRDGWIEAGNQREAFFPSLPHGRYRFRVEASVDGTAWRAAPTTLEVTVQPFFFQTAWFIGLVVAGGLLVAVGGYRYRTLQFRRRQAEMERLVQQKTEELRRANEELSRLSFLDALTGLANRRCFDEAFEKEWRRAQRFGTPLALVMADVDAFKAYNDALGHPEGDRCLAAIAGVFLRSVGRAGDLAARYGGEEFVVLVPGADRGMALAFAEKLRRGCEELAIPHPASPTGPLVTLSLGAAACQPAEGLAMADLLADADAALYRAKRGGRNRVE